MRTARAVFLDRDGVINDPVIRDGKPYPPASSEQVKLVTGATESLQRLKEHGFLLIVVTNQPDVRRGTTKKQTVDAIHQFLAARLPIDDFFVCLHDDEDRCYCRKPAPGLLQQAAFKYKINMEESFLIGDRWRDIDAGAVAGCRTVLIDYGYDERQPVHMPHFTAPSLMAAVNWIVSKRSDQT